jgi:glutaredoxin 3
MADQHTITVYSTPSCPYCHQAKNYLSQKGVPFTDKDVATDLQAREEMVSKSGQLGVPVIDVDGQVVVGFNRPKIDELLAV